MLSIPKEALKAIIKIQMEIAYLPIRFLRSLYNLFFKADEPASRCNDSIFIASPTLERESSTEGGVIKEVKDIRNVTLRAIATVTAKDLAQSKQMKAENEKRFQEIYSFTSKKTDVAKGVSRALKCLESAKVREDLNNEINSENEAIINESKVITNALHTLEVRDASTQKEFTTMVQEPDAEKEIVSFLASYKPFLSKGENPAMNDRQTFNSSIGILQTLAKVSIKENILLRRRLCLTNNKFEDVLDSFNSLIKEMSKLNKQLKKLTTLSTKMSGLQVELNEGKKLLQEVEADRNEMYEKLQTLRKMIKEEEEYLNDVNLERGISEFHILKCLEKRNS